MIVPRCPAHRRCMDLAGKAVDGWIVYLCPAAGCTIRHEFPPPDDFAKFSKVRETPETHEQRDP